MSDDNGPAAVSPTKAVTMLVQPSAPRQLGEEGVVILWRDGLEPGQREGLACILSACPDPACSCRLAHVDGFVIDGEAASISWDQDGVHVDLPAGSEPARTTLETKMIAIVDPGSGEITAHPDLPDATDPALIDWLAAEMNGELLEVLYRAWARAKGEPPQRRRADIDLDLMEECHMASFDEVFDGTRADEYLAGGRRYWTCIYLCPYSDCDCHQARVAFFDDHAASGDTVGSVLIDLGGAGGLRVKRVAAECGAPGHLIKDLWARFQRRHDAAELLRRREAQFKAVGETLWQPFAKPVRAAPKPGRNERVPAARAASSRSAARARTPARRSPTARPLARHDRASATTTTADRITPAARPSAGPCAPPAPRPGS